MSELLDILRREIGVQGPISLARYMELCLSHPQYGYYRKRDPLGQEGDFITAPEISQIFGELIGLWIVVVWQQMGRPEKTQLIELGPGRGTLMNDALRAAKIEPSFSEAIQLHLVDSSETLRKIQSKRLADYAPVWHDNLCSLPEGPMIVIANEFFDALPIRQFERGEMGWHERLVGLRDDGRLHLVLSSPTAVSTLIPEPYRNEAIGVTVEICPAAMDILSRFAAAIGCYGGAALIIDYGYDGSATGDTIQAVKRHSYCSLLETPGDTDLTAHVNFGQLIDAGTSLSTNVYGPVTQGAFLQSLGVYERAKIMMKHADECDRGKIEVALKRLVDYREMGQLFKVLAVGRKDALPPPGFQER